MTDRSVASFLAASHLKVSRHCQQLLARGGLTDPDMRRLRNLIAGAEAELQKFGERSEAA